MGSDMSPSDVKLISQMIKAGKYNAVYDLMPAANDQKSKEIIEKMGELWVCHPKNKIKRLEQPLGVLDQSRKGSKILKR
jgi:hypothetical protein